MLRGNALPLVFGKKMWRMKKMNGGATKKGMMMIICHFVQTCLKCLIILVG